MVDGKGVGAVWPDGTLLLKKWSWQRPVAKEGLYLMNQAGAACRAGRDRVSPAQEPGTSEPASSVFLPSTRFGAKRC